MLDIELACPFFIIIIKIIISNMARHDKTHQGHVSDKLEKKKGQTLQQHILPILSPLKLRSIELEGQQKVKAIF